MTFACLTDNHAVAWYAWELDKPKVMGAWFYCEWCEMRSPWIDPSRFPELDVTELVDIPGYRVCSNVLHVDGETDSQLLRRLRKDRRELSRVKMRTKMTYQPG